MSDFDLRALTPTDHVALFEQALSSVEEVCSQLTDDDWDRPTDCPGWTVKDNLSHLASYEAIAAGLASPRSDVDISGLTHVKRGDVWAEANEREVEARRALSGAEVLEEYRRATTASLKKLASLDDAGWQTAEIRTPVGGLPAKDALAIRILDVFYHEQDIRRATGKPGHLDGAVARLVFERMVTLALPRVIAKNAQAPDGTTVVLEVHPPGRTAGYAVEGGKGTLVDPSADPTVTLHADLEAFLCLMGGRKTPDDLQRAGRLRVAGDEELGRRILQAAVVVP